MARSATLARKARKTLLMLTLSTVGFGLQAIPAAAEGTTLVVSTKSYAGTGSAKFDWLRPRVRVAPAPTVVSQNTGGYLGDGAWICSPAGFGTKSKCFQR